MKGYVIKNCPARYFEFIDDEQRCFRNDKKCAECSDCLLKQIVERVSKFRSAYADEILDLLEIEEVDE